MNTLPLPDASSWRLRPGTVEDQDDIAVLLHRTFVVELGQHPAHEDGRHVDKFHQRNRYIVAEHEDRLIGMVALNMQAPFSVADRLPADGPPMADLADRPLEIRLWCVAPEWRGSALSFRLMAAVHEAALADGYRELWISAIADQLALYQRLGFQALGPGVPQGDAVFTPMRLRLDALPPRLVARARGPLAVEPTCHSFLPGPPYLADEVLQAGAGPSVYHRAPSFLQAYHRCQRLLSQHCHGMAVALLPGGGTSANDAVALALQHLPRSEEAPGLILANGEFGDRLRGHAKAIGLPFEDWNAGWARPWPLAKLRERMQQKPAPAWIWGVQVESSTGMANPVSSLSALVAEADLEHQVAIAIDGASAHGSLPVDKGLSFFVSVSGKGLEAKAGIAIVTAAPYWQSQLSPKPWPASLDLPEHWKASTPPHTLDGGLLAALDCSLRERLHPADLATHWKQEQQRGAQIRAHLYALGAPPLVEAELASPCLHTFRVPAGMTTPQFLELVRAWGFQLAGASDYLTRRGLAQLATFGPHPPAQLEAFFAAWQTWQLERTARNGQGNVLRALNTPASRP